jgi:hypothetical protein
MANLEFMLTDAYRTLLALSRKCPEISGAGEGTAIRVSESVISGEACWQEFDASASEKRTPSNPRD